MKYLLRISIFFIGLNVWSQNDYSSRWQEFYSYNQVVDFAKESNSLYAITDGAVFSYDLISNEYRKVSSVNGLSGSSTSTVHYSSNQNKIIVGYDNGLLEIIDENGSIKRVVDILLSDVSTEKRVNSIYEYDNKLFLSMPFGVLVYNLIDLEFEETYFIGVNSTAVIVNNVVISNGFIYAASNDGIYIADTASNLNDSNNWVKTFSGDFSQIIEFNEELLTVQDKRVSAIVNNSTLDLKLTIPATIVDMNSSDLALNIATSNQGFIYDINYSLIVSTENSSSFSMTSISSDSESVFLGTKERGILQSSMISPDNFIDIHPTGPVSNEIFSITVDNGDIWVVYGGHKDYTPLGLRRPIDHFKDGNWINISGDELAINGETQVEDLINVTIDPTNRNKVYISSWGAGFGDVASITKGGILILENDSFYDFWHAENSGLVNFNFPRSPQDYNSTRVGNIMFDESGNLWVPNGLISDGSGALKKMTPEGNWTGHELTKNAKHYDEIAIDARGNVWVGSQDEGLLVYNENFNGSEERAELTTDNAGLPEKRVKAIGVGVNGNIWIGTQGGLVLFSDVENVYSAERDIAKPVIIENNGVGSLLLGSANINDILVDGAGNLWFATTTGGVLKTSSTGKTTLEGFNTDNSPLPTNNVQRLSIDESTGTIYFGTSKGILSYNTGVASFGENLSDAYAFPNPALKQHNQISIVGKSSNFPEGANIKILDVAGNLVFESNAVESQSELGGKFVWDKTNLSGTKVASGVYIVLVYDAENNQTASTKIAIIN